MKFISEVLDRMPRPLVWASLGHALLAVAFLVASCVPAEPVMGLHPALKPLKFALSIALFLVTMGVLLPSLTVSATIRDALAWLFASTMVAEMLPILGQGLRGTTSHFNVRGALNRATWNLMVFAIVVATIGMVVVAILASCRPLTTQGGRDMQSLLAFAWRAGLWLLLLAPVSGFAMGGRHQHSIGGVDGGLGLPLVNWSMLHGDLRGAHFFALHAVQLLPILAWLLLRLVVAPWARWAMLSTAVVATAALCVGTLAQAFAGRPFIPCVAYRLGKQPVDLMPTVSAIDRGDSGQSGAVHRSEP